MHSFATQHFSFSSILLFSHRSVKTMQCVLAVPVLLCVGTVYSQVTLLPRDDGKVPIDPVDPWDWDWPYHDSKYYNSY